MSDQYYSDDEHRDKVQSNRRFFNLYFPPKTDIGRSNRHLQFKSKTVLPKFYSKEESTKIKINENDIKKTELNLSRETFVPNKKYDYPITENYKYGWYLEKYEALKGSESKKSHVNFRKHVDNILTERLMSFIKIRP